ncbi:hypothetical protein GCM10009624_31070 [Gordonia sinesedis]
MSSSEVTHVTSPAIRPPGGPVLDRRAVGWIIAFAALVIVAFAWAKWIPYWHKIPAVADSGSMGTPVIGDDGLPWFSIEHGWSFATAYLRSVWPAIVAGLVTAAAVQALLPRDMLVRFLGGEAGVGGIGGTGGVARAALAGLPTMLCTCCAAPLAVSLRRSNIAIRSALSFWLTNPLLNPAVLAFAFFALSPGWMLLRLGLGVVVLVAVLALTWRIGSRTGAGGVGGTRGDAAGGDVVGADVAAVDVAVVDVAGADMAGRGAAVADAGDVAEPAQGVRAFLRALLRYTITLVPLLVILVFLLGAFQGALFPLGQSLQSWGVGAVLLLAVAGMVIAVPTGAEIAVVAALLTAGAPAWLAAALLITLPATSLPSLAMAWRSFPHRVEVIVASVAVAGGLLGAAIAAVVPGW